MRIGPPWLVGIAIAALGFAGSAFGAEALPTVGPGATREEVFQAYGWPTGQSWFGTREVLNYPQGLVTLKGGRVQRVDFSAKIPWPAPRPQPPPPSPVSAKKAGAINDPWIEDFEVSAQEAARRGGPILALFTGRDWSPASRQFHEQVALHPDFVNALAAEVVFLRLDFSTRTPLGPKLREQYERLREQHGVTVYPTLMLLSPAGESLATIDLATPQGGEAFRARVISAVKAERARLAAQTAMTPVAVVPAGREAGRAEQGGTLALLAQIFGLGSTGLWVAAVVVAVGALLAWLLWRTRTPDKLPLAALAVRLSDGAGGVPTPKEIVTWPKEKVCAVTAALAVSEGYVAEIMPFGSDKDLLLMNRGETRPRVVVFCAAGNAEVVPARRLRELRGTLTAEGAQTGWFVSPKGFAKDALAYAEEHHLHLIDAARMVERLRELPPLLLPKVLPRAAVREAA